MDLKECPYCRSTDLHLAFGGVWHKRKPDHGPFDIYHCRTCGSAATLPPPSRERLAALYEIFSFGMSDFARAQLAENPEATWHSLCVDRLAELSGCRYDSAFLWVDIGAGGGEIAAAMARRFPRSRGIALDIHARPPALDKVDSVEWRVLDSSQDDFSSAVPERAEIVFATGVWEHVPRPDIFARNALTILSPSGVLYMTTPNWASWARRLFGRSWPYLIPGEHLCMPSPRGAELCLQRELLTLFGEAGREDQVRARPVLISYSLRFVAAKFGLETLAGLLPHGFKMPLPSGAMETVVRRRADIGISA